MIRNVVIINDHAVINGGQAKVAITSAMGLAKSGLNVVFFAGQGPADPSLAQAGIRVVCLDQHDILSDPSRLRAMARGIWNTEAARRLKELLGEFSPTDTIVHCHGFAKVLSGSIGPVITGHAIPHVFTMHEYFLACPNGGFFHYPDNKICTRKALGPACLTTNCDPRRASHKAWRVARQLAVNTAGRLPSGLKNVIYISQTQRRAMEPYLSNDTKLFSVANPIDAEQQPRVDVQRNDIFLFVGRLSPEKGASLFAEAARLAGVKAVFVGEGEERSTIERIRPSATVTGWQTPEQVAGWLGQARCVVFPSLWYECQPLVPYEALARGIPVIAGQWTAASECIEDEINGRRLMVPTAQELANALGDFAARDLTQMGRDSWDRYWASPLNRESHIANLTTVYGSIRGS